MNHKLVFETQFDIANGNDGVIKAVLRSDGRLSVEYEMAWGENTITLVTDRETLVRILRYSPDSDTVVITPSNKGHWSANIRVNRGVIQDFLDWSKRAFALPY